MASLSFPPLHLKPNLPLWRTPSRPPSLPASRRSSPSPNRPGPSPFPGSPKPSVSSRSPSPMPPSSSLAPSHHPTATPSPPTSTQASPSSTRATPPPPRSIASYVVASTSASHSTSLPPPTAAGTPRSCGGRGTPWPSGGAPPRRDIKPFTGDLVRPLAPVVPPRGKLSYVRRATYAVEAASG
ncbi:unnamed protein product, partial [Musa acuminata subsp. burmannicoides]